MFVRVAELTVSARRDLERMVITRSGISWHAFLCGGGLCLGIGRLSENKQAPNGGGTVQAAPLAAMVGGIHVG